MTDYGTIKIPREVYEQHNEQRKEMGLTWEEYLEGQVPETPVYGDTNVEEVLGRLEDLETSIPSKTADELEGRFKR